jgi:hypothetical protein
MRALRAWYNGDHEGDVQVGDEFEASPYRARDLERLTLAIPVVGETEKIVVRADAPAAPATKARRQSRS